MLSAKLAPLALSADQMTHISPLRIDTMEDSGRDSTNYPSYSGYSNAPMSEMHYYDGQNSPLQNWTTTDYSSYTSPGNYIQPSPHSAVSSTDLGGIVYALSPLGSSSNNMDQQQHFSPIYGTEYQLPLHYETSSNSTATDQVNDQVNSVGLDKPPTPPGRPEKVLCKVCGDVSTGNHYGVSSCEGCKGFFRRSVSNSMRYKCSASDGNCQITRVTRTKCQLCRYLKCLDMGMKIDECIGKRRSSKMLPRKPAFDLDDFTDEALNAALPLLSNDELTYIIQTLTHCQEQYSMYTTGKLLTVMVEDLFYVKLNQFSREEAWTKFVSLIEKDVYNFREQIKQMPGYDTLSEQDRDMTMNNQFLRYYWIRIYRGMNKHGFIVGLKHIMGIDGFHIVFGTVAERMIQVAEILKAMELSDETVAVLTALALLTPDVKNLNGSNECKSLRLQILAALKYQLNREFPLDPFILKKLMNIVKDLQFISIEHAADIEQYRGMRNVQLAYPNYMESNFGRLPKIPIWKESTALPSLALPTTDQYLPPIYYTEPYTIITSQPMQKVYLTESIQPADYYHVDDQLCSTSTQEAPQFEALQNVQVSPNEIYQNGDGNPEYWATPQTPIDANTNSNDTEMSENLVGDFPDDLLDLAQENVGDDSHVTPYNFKL